MRLAFDARLVKGLVGALIICAAFAIMMPGLLSYLGGLLRIMLIVAITLVTATILARLYVRIKHAARKAKSENAENEVQAHD